MFQDLYQLMGMMFLMMTAGYLMRRKEIITAAGRKCLTDLILTLVLPCNIIKAFCMEMNAQIWQMALSVLIMAVTAQVISLVAAQILYGRMPKRERQVFQYATVCSNSGFIGNPVAEGVFGATGLLYASIFLIPQRIVMWTAGVSYFYTGEQRKGQVYKKILTNPCMVATYVGLLLMATQWRLPEILERTVRSFSGCTTPLTMLYIGTILVDVRWKGLVDTHQIYFAFIRLAVIPAAVFLVCYLVRMDRVAAGVCTLLSAMPGGSSTSLLAAKYGADEMAAAKCVVFTTVLSVVTIPLWSILFL